MSTRQKLPPGLFRRRRRDGTELPELWCYYYVRGRAQPPPVFALAVTRRRKPRHATPGDACASRERVPATIQRCDAKCCFSLRRAMW